MAIYSTNKSQSVNLPDHVMKLTTPVGKLAYSRISQDSVNAWKIVLASDPTYTYGTFLVLYDDGRREMHVLRPGEEQIVEL
jgi:hypothetical protein